jgi:hypothetical protein
MRLWSSLALGRVAMLPATFIVMLLVYFTTTWVPSLAQAATPWPAVGYVVGISVAVPLCIWSARLMRRFSARLIPLRASGKRRLVVTVIWGAQALTSLLSALALAALLVHPVVPPTDRLEQFVAFYSVALGIAYAIAFVGLAAEYYRGRPRDDQYVLYLRTFLSFSDRAMMAVLFSLVGGRRRVVVLTAPRSDAASWDPILVGFRGNPIFRLRAKVPVFMTATDDDWHTSIRDLIAGATQTVVDVSMLTPGVLTELEILRDVAKWSGIVWLCEASRGDALDRVRAMVGDANVPEERVVLYRRSIAAALPRIVGGLSLSLLFLVALPASFNISQGHAPDVGLWLFMAVPFSVAVFARRAVDRRARHRLRSLLTVRR